MGCCALTADGAAAGIAAATSGAACTTEGITTVTLFDKPFADACSYCCNSLSSIWAVIIILPAPT